MDSIKSQNNPNETRKPSFGSRIFLFIAFIVFVFVGLLVGYSIKDYLVNEESVSEVVGTEENTATKEVSTENKEVVINDGIITSPDGSFSVYIGENIKNRALTLSSTNPDTSGSFAFCYQLTDKTYESGTCPVGYSPLFTINRYTKAQFDTMLEAPFFEATADEGYRTEGGYYYTLSHPNGDLPEEILPNLPAYNWGEYYTTVLDSLIAK